jgi:transcriptional regulator with XRE-family HTH domain
MVNEVDVNEYAARQLRTLRAARGLSQTKLARKMNISTQQVQKYEWGINHLSISRLVQYAHALEVSVTVFFPAIDIDHPCEPIPQHTVRFLKLLNKILPRHWDDIYDVLKVMARLSGREPT